MKWTYTTEAVVTVRVEIDVEADTKDEALDRASRILPLNMADGTRAGWKGKVELIMPPRKGVVIRPGKILCVEGASGPDKIRKAKDST